MSIGGTSSRLHLQQQWRPASKQPFWSTAWSVGGTSELRAARLTQLRVFKAHQYYAQQPINTPTVLLCCPGQRAWLAVPAVHANPSLTLHGLDAVARRAAPYSHTRPPPFLLASWARSLKPLCHLHPHARPLTWALVASGHPYVMLFKMLPVNSSGSWLTNPICSTRMTQRQHICTL